jgi:superfamily II DNA or RNA helicase
MKCPICKRINRTAEISEAHRVRCYYCRTVLRDRPPKPQKKLKTDQEPDLLSHNGTIYGLKTAAYKPTASILEEFCLFPDQAPHASILLRVINEQGAAIDGSDAGAGKTYIAAWIAKKLDKPTIVIAPKITLNEWGRVLSGFKVRAQVFTWEKMIRGIPGVVDRYSKGDILNAAKLRGAQYNWQKGYFIIFDEAHKAKASKSLMSKACMASKEGNLKLLLSATLAENPEHMMAAGYLTNLHDGKGFYMWCHQYLWSQQCRFNLASPEERSVRLHRAIYPSKGSRLRLHEVQKLPERFIQPECYEVDNTNALHYLWEEVEPLLLDPNPTHSMTAMQRMRRMAEHCRIRLLKDMTLEAIESGQSVCIFLNFRENIEILSDLLDKSKVKHGIIYGGVRQDERDHIIQAFRADRIHVVLLSIQAGGAGISLHDEIGNRQRLSLISPTFSAVDLVQVLGRTYRANTKTPVIQKLIFAAGFSVEEDACRRVAAKIKDINMINDGDLFPYQIQIPRKSNFQ